MIKKHRYALLQRGKRYYKVEQLIHYKLGQSLLNGGACITKKSALLPDGTGITYWGKTYYKIGQSLWQSEVGLIKWVNFIAKLDNCYRKGQYIFVTLGQMKTNVYRQSQCGLRKELWGLLIFIKL